MGHYAARNLLDSTGILLLASQTMGPAGEDRLGRASWARLLTSDQRPSPTSSRPFFADSRAKPPMRRPPEGIVWPDAGWVVDDTALTVL